MRHILIVSILISLFPVLLVTGCNQSQVEPANKESPPAPVSERNIPSEPSPPITTELSFPNGAPSLNQEAELSCIIKAPAISIMNMTVEIRLPEALELVSSNLSWFGDINSGDELEVIRANVRAVNTGNWAIEIRQTWYPERQSSLSFYPDWQDGIYVSISEDSAEWREYPPYRVPSSTPGVAQVEQVDETTVPIVDLTISHAPLLNEQAEVTCTISSLIDMPGTNAQIELTYGGDLVGGNLEWQGDLKAGVPVTFSAQIVFKGTGLRYIGWHVWQTGKEYSWANLRLICLRIGEDESSFCEELIPVLPPSP